MNVYRILETWDDGSAQLVYRLQIQNKRGDKFEPTIYSGDAKWAKRQAKHYNCEIVTRQNKDGTNSEKGNSLKPEVKNP
jgi:hypothetical protein